MSGARRRAGDRALGFSLVFAGLIALVSMSAHAEDSVADFYHGKQVQLRIGTAPGTGYDLAGRLVAPYLGKYLPGNPTVIVQNVPGAGSLTLANQLANNAPKDGTIIGVVTNGMPTAPLLTPDTARFDVSKFGWIGSQAPETQVVLVSANAPVQTLADVFTKELIVGGVAPGTATVDMPLVTNAVMGTKFKIVSGYESTGALDLAMERGEIQGQAADGWASFKSRNLAWLKEGKVRIIAQYGFEKHPELPDVPLFGFPADEAGHQAMVLMYARQEYGRPLVAPPGVPPERLAALRQAFAQSMKDPDFLADAKKAQAEVNPVSGEALEKLTAEIVKTSPDVLARVSKILEAK
jgi:tripartite-type tricarboxylate transporter receptor subunit TctC